MRTRPLAFLAALVALTASLTGCAGASSDTAADTASTREANGPACTFESGGQPAAKKVDLPPDRATVSGEVPAIIATSEGDITMTLDADAAPCAATSFASLADQGYFDDVACHRLTTSGIFVLQCGDPTGTGGGGPGYSFADEIEGSETYPAGTLAMANAGPDTNGSQFFIVYADSPLDAAYTVFGHVDDDAVKTVEDVAKKGVAGGAGDGAPAEDVTITSVTVD